MSSTVEQIKERLDIADIVGSYLKLERAGGNFKACCPFHNEKTPSFFISPSRQTYHCFGCNRGGDMFSFVQEIEGMDFPGSLKILADRAGVEIKKENISVKTEKEKLFAVLEEASIFFEKKLKGQDDVISYLKKRGLTGNTAKRFNVGYAPGGWSNLYDVLKEKGYTDVLMEKAGLIIKGEKGYYDRFRSRIMFPISDISGRISGFSGRVFGSESDKTAKYVNSPETELYNKSKILYGFDKAKLEIRKKDVCILVEGQMDLLMSHQAGLLNTVAVSGTALTQEHLKFIKRLTDNLVIAFDPDEAGIDASRRGVDIALSLGLDVKIAVLPNGLDPADLILQDKEKWIKKIEDAQHIIDFYINALANKNLDQRNFKIKVGELVLPYVAKLKNKINQAHFVVEIARKLGIAEEPIWEELRGISVNNKQENKNILDVDNNKQKNQPVFTRKEMVERKILGILLWQKELENPTLDIDIFTKKYEEIINSIKKTHVLNDEKKKEYIFEAEIYYSDTKNIKEESEALAKYLGEEVLKEEFTQTMNELRNAENKGDTAAATKFLKQCQEISKKINNIK